MDNGNTGYPWSQGDPLLAADLNAAIANSIGLSSGTLPLNGSLPMTGPLTLSGNATLPLHAVPLQQVTSAVAAAPFLPLDGATPMTGPLTLSGNATLALHAVPLQQLTSAVTIPVPPGGSIQAAHDALPATGGSILLAANTTYVLTAPVTITKPNVHVSAPSWSTVVQRAPTNTGGASSNVLINLTGNNCTLEGFTVDGNSVLHIGSFEVATSGDNSLVRNMQIINGKGAGHLALAGNNSRATGNTIVGLGIDYGVETGYGIWAANHQTVLIDNNTVIGTCADGIGFDGPGTRVIGNRVTDCHLYQANAGSQIATYFATALNNSGAQIIGNYVTGGGGTATSGIELVAPNMLCSGNSIDSVNGQGILLIGNGAVVTGNTLHNTPSLISGDGIVVQPNVTDFVITGNRVFDDRATPLLRWAISVAAGTSDRYTIVGNLTVPNNLNGVVDQASGLHKTIAHNTGQEDSIPNVVVTAALAVPMNPVVNLFGAGPVTSITGGNATGRTVTFISNAATVFTAGSNIANSVTMSVGIPTTATFDGTLWHISNALFSGGAVAGATTFSAAGTALTVTNNASIGGTLTVGTNTVASDLSINGGAGTTRRIEFDTAGSLRWRIYANITAEGGSNAGSDFGISAYSDTGAVIMDPVLAITRSTGLSNFVGPLQVSAGLGCGQPSVLTNTDLSKGVALYSTTNGFNVANGRLNYVSAVPQVFIVGGADKMTITSTGMGFNGTAAVAKPTVSGAKGSNAALASLITALAAYGLVTDSTSA